MPGKIPGGKSVGRVDVEAADRIDDEGPGGLGAGFFVRAPEKRARRTAHQDKKKGDEKEADQHVSPAKDKD